MCSLTLLAAMILAATPASALEYTEADAAAGSFGKPTASSQVTYPSLCPSDKAHSLHCSSFSDCNHYVGLQSDIDMDNQPVTVIGGSNAYETDVSKNAAYIPPAFGSPMSDLPSSGELLTPNLTGGSAGTVTGGGTVTIIPPSTSGGTTGSTASTGYTAVTSDLYYSGGYLGTLSAPAIGLSVKVYQGTDSTALKNGAGHFESTSIWDGNVAFAGHNRGVNNNFGKIHTLENSDTIKLTTKLGTRSYTVYSVRKVSVNDVSVLDSTGENIVTLVTCVMNQPDYRWCVQAREK